MTNKQNKLLITILYSIVRTIEYDQYGQVESVFHPNGKDYIINLKDKIKELNFIFNDQ